jgi:hypothetical protein
MAQVCAYRQVGQNHLNTPTGYSAYGGETPIHQGAVAMAQADIDNGDNTGASRRPEHDQMTKMLEG